MARHMGDTAETFRAVLEFEQPRRNPAHHWRDNPDVPEYLDEWVTTRRFRGPYSTQGVARGQFSRQRRALWGASRNVRQYVERATTVWEEVTDA
ncbi:hypothetical protein NPS70_16325 [Streptomyces sp. C10-9-1]|uniref:hypothetical protein n=1 Tax=Streptomyces sp. C10-9-1 TaxID=1859285 RepID=UPI0021118E46|nr:hypothetical protein [Streptomyces sp. C10-9-1]MCQ6554752.1 hypothetical protein [Streptomyces sp. C10-9-1]